MSGGETRNPDATVLLNGVQVAWYELTVSQNSYRQADRFEVSLPVASLPSGLRRPDLAAMAVLNVEIRLSLDGSTWVSMIIGVTDEISDDYIGGLIHLSGRDNTARFIETKTTEKFLNQTASAVVQTLAARQGMTADVTQTKGRVGQYYQIDHDRLTDQSSEWDLLIFLADHENYDLWVTGQTLHFHPASMTHGDPVVVAYAPPGQGGLAAGAFTRLSTRRQLTLASDVTVTVLSWNARQKQAVKATAKATKAPGKQPLNNPQTYSFRVPGLIQAQAQQLAQAKAEEISRHERVLDIDLPGDVTTTARSQIQLTGTGTAFDQLYWVDEIERRLSMSEGFRMTLKVKNHSPQTVTVG